MLRFSKPDDSASHLKGLDAGRAGRSTRSPLQKTSSLSTRLRLPLLFVALLLVLAARARLKQPEVHQAIGQILEGPIASAPDLAGENQRATPPTFGSDEVSMATEGNNSSDSPISYELLATIRDNTPFRSDEQEAWFALLANLQRSSYEQQASQSRGTVGYATLISAPDNYRGKFITVVGIPRRVDKVSPAENDLGIEQLYRITIEPIGGDVWPITIYTLNDPQLAIDESTNPPTISSTGYFFKNQSYRWAEGVGSMPVIVAKDISRTVIGQTAVPSDTKTPTSGSGVIEAQPDFPIGDSSRLKETSLGRALLTDLGVDLDGYSKVKDQRAFSSDETESFYATLDAVKKTPARQLARLAEGGLASYVTRHGFDSNQVNSIPTDRQMVMRRLISKEAKRGRYSAPILFGKASEQRGELLSFDGIVRRVVRIEVADREIDHYYELELFPEDSQNLPLIYCMTDLPAGFPVGESIRQPARLVGFFFKQWAYRSRNRGGDTNNQAGIDSRRFAPLLIGRAPIPLATPDASAYRPGWGVGIIGTGLLMAMILGIVAFRRMDKNYEQRITAKLRETPKGDFSHLP